VACAVAGVFYKSLQDQAELQRYVTQIEAQQRELMRRASPVIQVWRDVLVVPVIGEVDAHRAHHMAEKLMADVVERRAREVIFDLTGVETIDQAGAEHLLRICRAVVLLGARCSLSGISPDLASLVIAQRIDFGGIESYGSLQHALRTILGVGEARSR
jgi:rsbT co-antagonist protein RsbR